MQKNTLCVCFFFCGMVKCYAGPRLLVCTSWAKFGRRDIFGYFVWRVQKNVRHVGAAFHRFWDNWHGDQFLARCFHRLTEKESLHLGDKRKHRVQRACQQLLALNTWKMGSSANRFL